jgi:nucleoid DNA-binding protein
LILKKRCFHIFTPLKSNIVKLAKYIYDLLLENDTVIIPGFGAFISTYKPAIIGENEIKPPSKEISFTRQIRNNDGILVTAIARKAKISQPNALKRIERERENILYRLDKGEKVSVENVGVLFYDEKNEISFTPFQKDNLLLDSFGFEIITVADAVEKPEEAGPAKNFTEEITVTEGPEINIKTENTDKTVSEIISSPTESEPVSKEEVIPENEKEMERIKLSRPLPDWAVKQPVKRKKTGRFWYLLILIPIFIGGYFIINRFSKSTPKEIYRELTPQSEKQEIVIQTITPSDTALSDSVTDKEVVETIKPETTENPILTDTKYYIVGGGFKNEENAEKFIVRLKDRGIEGILLGKKGSLYLVGIASFNTENEAYNSLNELVKKYPDWNLWVYKK